MVPQTRPLRRALKDSQHFVMHRPGRQHLYDPGEYDDRVSNEALCKPFQMSSGPLPIFVGKCGKGQSHASWHKIWLAVESATRMTPLIGFLNGRSRAETMIVIRRD